MRRGTPGRFPTFQVVANPNLCTSSHYVPEPWDLGTFHRRRIVKELVNPRKCVPSRILFNQTHVQTGYSSQRDYDAVRGTVERLPSGPFQDLVAIPNQLFL
jgi:hypothetical protein